MAQIFQLRRGTRAENDQFTGVEGEIVAVIDQTDTNVTTIRIHDDVLLGGHEVARADLLNTADGTVTISEFATSLSQGGGPDTIIRYDSFGVAQFVDDFPGSQITPGTLNVSALVGPVNQFLTFDGTGVVLGQTLILTADILDNSVIDFNFLDASVDTPQITLNSIGENDFGYLIVNSDKLANNAVGNSRIANSAVTTAKIADSAVDPVIHMPSQSITNAKFATDAVDNFRLASDTLRRDNVDAGSAGNARGARRIDDVDPDDAIGNEEDLYYQVQGPNSPTPPIPATPLLPPTFTTGINIPSALNPTGVNVDLNAEFIFAGWNGSDTIDNIVTVIGNISSTTTTTAALIIADIPAGSKVALVVNGGVTIAGKGGEGGQGRNNGFGGNSSIFDGKDGGDAIRLVNPNIQITLTNNGTIGAGGGGGGGGGASSYELTGVDSCTSGGGGGGGGAGVDPGAGGLKTDNILSPDPAGLVTDATDGSLGNTLTGGAGGTNATGGNCGTFIGAFFLGTTNGGGVGGAGGNLGQPGGPGSAGLGSSGTGPGFNTASGTVAGGTGGQSGVAIFGISSFIVVTPGTIEGPQIS